jgi:hypothetical protein
MQEVVKRRVCRNERLGLRSTPFECGCCCAAVCWRGLPDLLRKIHCCCYCCYCCYCCRRNDKYICVYRSAAALGCVRLAGAQVTHSTRAVSQLHTRPRTPQPDRARSPPPHLSSPSPDKSPSSSSTTSTANDSTIVDKNVSSLDKKGKRISTTIRVSAKLVTTTELRTGLALCTEAGANVIIALEDCDEVCLFVCLLLSRLKHDWFFCLLVVECNRTCNCIGKRCQSKRSSSCT